MWIRAELKERAKNVLRKYYWVAFLVTLVASILGGTQGGTPINFRFNANNWHSVNNGFGSWNWNSLDYGNQDVAKMVLGILAGTMVISSIFFIVLLFSFAFKIFVSGPIETGMDYYFLQARQDRSDFVNLFYGFRGGRYMNVVKANAWRLLFTFLWTLLFIIPGWVKGYSYSMIPYIMADNPNMDYKRAMTLSMAMTNGQKWEIFVLDLSFIGWYLLGLLVCCVGTVFVPPYHFATKAELYVVLRQNAIDKGLCTADEVGQQMVPAM